MTEDVEVALDYADRMADETDVRYSHDEMFSKLREVVNGRFLYKRQDRDNVV